MVSATPHAGIGAALRRVEAALEAHGCGPPRAGFWRCPVPDHGKGRGDRHPSLAVAQGREGATLHCKAECDAGAILDAIGLDWPDAFDFPKEKRERTRSKARPKAASATTSTPREATHEIEELGPPTAAQLATLIRGRRIRNPETLARVGALHVRARFRDADSGEWRGWGDYLGLPALGSTWMLYGIRGDGGEWLDDDGKLRRFSAGPCSLIVSPDLRERNGARLDRLYDLEGAPDLLAWIDCGGVAAIASTGGAGALGGHDAHVSKLLGLDPAEAVIVRDLDSAGRVGAAKVADWYLHHGIAVRVPILPEALGDGGDVRDYLTGRDGGEALGGAADLDALADAAELRLPEPTQAGEALGPILADVEAFLARFVVFKSRGQRIAVTLWIAHTHVFDRLETTPYLAVTSPEKRSGKTRLLDALELLVARAWRAITPSEAVVFRKIDRDRPTLLLDEVDAIYGPKAREHEGLRAILNAGHQRGSPVPRCVGKDFQLRDFDVYCPKALAGIGDLPDTVADRSIPIRLQRRRRGERVEKFRRAQAEPVGRAIHKRLAAWAEAACLPDSLPEPPAALNDRASDGWEPLLAIADAAGGEWPALARSAALELNGSPTEQDESLGVRLLADLRALFERRAAEVLFTAVLLDELRAIEEAPWGDFRGKSLTPRTFAGLLRPFGIHPGGTVRVGEETAKGYRRAAFEDAWSRYLPASPSESGSETSQRHNAANSITYEDSEPSQAASREGDPSQSNPLSEHRVAPECDVVTDSGGEEGEADGRCARRGRA